MLPKKHKHLSFRLRADLFAQLAQLETAGVPFDRAFAILRMPPDATSRFERMQKLAANGRNPAEAGEQSGLFTKLEARLIQAALIAGSPAALYRKLADFYTDRAMQIATMKSRLMLPAFMFVAALFIQPLPALATGSIGIFGYLWQALKPILLIGAAYYALRTLTSGDARSAGKSSYQSVPIVGPIFIRRNLRDFFESLGWMLEAGVSMLDALPAALDAVEDGDMRRELAKIRTRIEKGAPLAAALVGVSYIKNDRVIQFVQTGEASGTLPEMLLRHTKLESAEIDSFYQQLADWLPRLIYSAVALWMAYGIVMGGGFMPKMPANL